MVKADDAQALVTVPAEAEGRLVLVGTDIRPNETVPEKDRVKVKVGFLAVEVDAKNDPKAANIVPEKWWASLDPTGAKAYVRWKPGDELPPGRLFVVREEREYRKLHVGDAIEEGQLLGIVDEEIALDDVAIRSNKLETAESEFVEAGKTKQEAQRRANESKRLYELHTGVISLDAYYADLLNAARYAEEEKGRDSARKVASRELQASLTLLKLHEIRSLDRGVVKEILKRRGEAIRNLEPIVRLEVEDAASRGTDKAATPAATVVHVPAQRDGVLLVVGTVIKEGEKVPADRVVLVKIDGEEKRYRRLREGDEVEEGQLLARLDDRLARLDVEEKKDRVEAAEADVRTAAKTRAEAERRFQALTELRKNNAALVSEDDFNAAKLNVDRWTNEEKGKTSAVKGAEVELKAADTVLEMYEVRSPVRGVVKAIGKNRGEAVKALETVVEIEEKKE